jgi:threonine synthase
VREIIQTFKETGKYVFKNFDSTGFTSSRSDDAQIEQIIKDVYLKYGYVADPHTACGFEQGFEGKEIILATAHPAKFPDTIQAAIGGNSTHASLEVLKSKEIVKHSVLPSPSAIKAFMRARI